MAKKKVSMYIDGMDCPSCAADIEQRLAKFEGVERVRVAFSDEKAFIEYDTEKTNVEEIRSKIHELGYSTKSLKVEERKGFRLDLLRLFIVGLAIVVSLTGFTHPFFSLDIAAIFAVIISGIPIFRSTFFSLRRRTITAEVAMATGMAACILIGQYLSAAVIGFFMLLAEFIDGFTKDKARSAISGLIKISPKIAVVKRDGREIEVGVEEVRHGDLVVVRSGETIPVDGTVIKGYGSVNQASITGESMPMEKKVGDDVFAGTINQVGTLEIKVTRVGKDTTLGRIIESVEEAEVAKAPIQKLADRFASRFLPIVFLVALITFFLTRNITNSISVIVVACPCAVVLGTPLAVVAGIGNAAEKGIIVKGGVYLEELGKTDTVVLDKTGTITIGEPKVISVKSFDKHEESEIIALAAMAESHSEHPLASAIIKQAEKSGIRIEEHDHCEILPGKGITALCNGQKIFVGSRELLKERSVIPEDVERFVRNEEEHGRTALLVAHDNELCGVISVADVVREEAKGAIEELKKKGIRVIMLTGDNPRTAKAIAQQIGIDEVFAEMLPEEKVEKIKELARQGRKVVMVGDGINDAPALAEASVGIAMGAVGTDVAIEASDVALMTDDLTKITEAVKTGRKTFGAIEQNLAGSIIFNIVGISLASLGFLNPFMAAVAHSLPDLVLFLNSSRLIRR
jgi:heavy metal translocating P-type ATPase